MITISYGGTQGRRRRGERIASFGPFGEFFFFPSCFFLSLNNIYSNYDYIIATEGLREGGDEENGPKRRESRRLGH